MIVGQVRSVDKASDFTVHNQVMACLVLARASISVGNSKEKCNFMSLLTLHTTARKCVYSP